VHLEGATCDRCDATRHELERAVAVLEHVLGPLDVEPRLQVVEIDEASFDFDAGTARRIWISGKSIEDWLAETVGGATGQPMSERLILKAALVASSELIDDMTLGALTSALVGRGVSPSLAATPAR
jgi:hypothetical protein